MKTVVVVFNYSQMTLKTCTVNQCDSLSFIQPKSIAKYRDPCINENKIVKLQKKLIIYLNIDYFISKQSNVYQ